MPQAIVDPAELRRFAQMLKKFNAELTDRTTALAGRVSYYTTIAGAKAACAGMKHLAQLEPYRLQDLHAKLRPAEAA